MEKPLSQNMLQNVSPQEQPKQEDQGIYLPKILDMKIYYGLGEKDEKGERKPDPSKILFYEDSNGHCYDTSKQEWLQERPVVCDHLPNRPILNNDQDIIAAIAHGVMEDNDYQALDRSGMLGEMPKKLWESIQKLKILHEQLQQEQLKKTEEEQSEQVPVDPDLRPEGHGESEINEESNELDSGPPGEDVISQIVQAAMADADDRIREIVREELAKILSEDFGPESDREWESDAEMVELEPEESEGLERELGESNSKEDGLRDDEDEKLGEEQGELKEERKKEAKKSKKKESTMD
ncbi:MAG: hypothetical protein QXL01_07750 [Thermoplasmatales archaeon]